MKPSQAHFFRGFLPGVQVLLVVVSLCFLSGCTQSEDTEISHKDAPAAESGPMNENPFGGESQTEGMPAGESQILTVTPASIRSNNGSAIQSAGLEQYREGSEDYSLPLSGTPEWDIREISLLLTEGARTNSDSAESSTTASGNLSKMSNESARRIIALASHAISETHTRPEKELIFNTAVQSLMEARLKLAVSGEKRALDALYEDAETLAKNRHGSTASLIAAGTIVRLAREMAQTESSDSPWVSEYVRQVKLFAANFPEEEARSIMQLTSAAEFCEKRQLTLPAIECYTTIQQQFPKSPFRSKSDAALERLGLIGKTISLQGPTIDGGTFRLSEKTGHSVLLVFWSMRSKAFEQDVELLNRLVTESHLQLVGINMDTDAAAVKQFIQTKKLPGDHVFYSDFSQQGAAQPMARQFGINAVPTYWFIDEQGRVLATNATREQLRSLLVNP